jgi:peroxiredoxin Q/BCP
MSKIKVGDAAPAFSGLTTEGDPVTLADFAGQKLVLYFYPKDDTPGCTKQACSLRDHNAEIRAKGAAILGVSTQDQASHKRFTDKYGLNFPLLADVDGRVASCYGALGGGGLKSIAMKVLGLANRVTFIIDESGHVQHIIDDPNCANHAGEVLALL